MSDPAETCLILATEDDTARLGAWLADRAGPGDTFLLQGPIGAGKSHLARAFIRRRMGVDTEVPSPTFTLVQTYGEGPDEIWHADLYRLSHPDEVAELGLSDALGRAICLIEWPDRLGADRPARAIALALSAAGDGRRAVLSCAADPARPARLVEGFARDG